MDTLELPLIFATAGLVGLGGLAVMMGAAFCSLAELLALLRDEAGRTAARRSGKDAHRRGRERALLRSPVH